MDRLILGIDAGNYGGKTIGQFGEDTFKTNICDWFIRDVEETFGNDDMEFEINGRKGFAGTIAQYEDEFGDGTRYGDTKAHEDTKIRVLLAINRYLNRFCPHIEKVSVVTGQPIKRHNQAEKNLIINMLKGTHNIKVNNQSRKIIIENVGVVGEGSGAFWVNPQMGLVRIIDVGSGTVNAATIIDKKFVNTASTTFNFGVETVNDKNDFERITRGIVRNTTKLKWNKQDEVLICGGTSEKVLPYIQQHYNSSKLISPMISKGYGDKLLHSVFANAVGFYNLGKAQFQ